MTGGVLSGSEVPGPGPSRSEGPLGPGLWVGAVALEVDRLLLVRRSSPPEAGRWSVPATAVALGEPLVAAVVRAVDEDAGLEAVCGRPLGHVEQHSCGHRVLLAFEATVLSAAAPAPAASWAPLDEVSDRLLVEGLAELLADLGILRLIA